MMQFGGEMLCSDNSIQILPFSVPNINLELRQNLKDLYEVIRA